LIRLRCGESIITPGAASLLVAEQWRIVEFRRSGRRGRLLPLSVAGTLHRLKKPVRFAAVEAPALGSESAAGYEMPGSIERGDAGCGAKA